MTVRLRFQTTGAVPDGPGAFEMTGPSLTIGRGKENDVVLPDPDRTISKRHCVLEARGGDLVVLDLSTNGTFLNYGAEALGAIPTPLNNGDVLTLGPYEMVVEMEQSAAQPRDPFADIAPPVQEGPVSHGSAAQGDTASSLIDDPSAEGDFLDEMLGTPATQAGAKNLIPDDPLGPDPLGDEPLLGPGDDPLADAPDPFAHEGASVGDHAPSTQDVFTEQKASRPIIPDDWDDDLLAPSGGGRGGGGGGGPGAAPPDPFADAPDPTATGPSAPIPQEPRPMAPQAPAPTPGEPERDPLDDLLGDGSLTPPQDPPPPSGAPAETGPAAPPAEPSPPVASPEPRAAPASQAPRPAAQAPGDAAAARAFLDALGVERSLVPDDALAPTMAQLGRVMHAMITGMREVLMTRASIKGEFRMSQTMIGSTGNNPLKFSISPEQAVEAMVRPARGYLPPEEAAAEALDDVKAHEVATVTGMQAALKELLHRLDPAVLTEKIETGGALGGLLKGKKARYWEVYEKMYAEIAEEAEENFQEVFGKAFARAYEEQLRKLKKR